MTKTIAILAPSGVPFEMGGSEKLWWGLRGALSQNCLVELIKLPCREKTFADIIDAYEMFSKLDLNHFDILITTKYPAWLALHHNHICYYQHPLRGLYDLYHFTGLPEKLTAIPPGLRDLMGLIRKDNPERADLPPFFELCRAAQADRTLPKDLFEFPGPLIREATHFLDKIALAPGAIKSYFAISQTVAGRKDYFPENALATVLPHPSDLQDFHCDLGQYFFTASRLNSSKRISLLVDAMRYLPLNISLKIAGIGPELDHLKARAANDKRIEFLGMIPDAELPKYYANAIAVPFVPYQEDYGLITVEAMKSGKPVITTTDAGGPCEYVKHGETGLVVEPNPRALGEAMAKLGSDRSYAALMGEKARQSVEAISWQNVACCLLGYEASLPAKKLLILAPFAADNAGSGGPRRLYHFCKALSSKFQIELVCYGMPSQLESEIREMGSNWQMRKLPLTKDMIATAESLAKKYGQSADDFAIMRCCASDQALLDAIAEARADAVILSHPWLYSALEAASLKTPVLYDGHNVEADLKSQIFADSEIAVEAASLECRLCANAARIFACSSTDLQRFAELYQLEPDSLAMLANGCDAPAEQADRSAIRQRLAYPEQKLALFLGSGHKPNQDAALAIIAMAREMPEVQFLLAGSVSTQPDIRNAAKPDNVHLLGIVSEKAKNVLLAACDLALNPITSGSGSNLKLLEYLAWGMPTISTAFGSRGLTGDLTPALTLCDLSEFPGQIRRLLAKPPDVETMRSIGSQIAARHSWQASFSGLNKIVAEVIEKCDAAAD